MLLKSPISLGLPSIGLHNTPLIFGPFHWNSQSARCSYPIGGDQKFSISSMFSQFITIMALMRFPLRSTCLCVGSSLADLTRLSHAGQSFSQSEVHRKNMKRVMLTLHHIYYSGLSYSTFPNAPRPSFSPPPPPPPRKSSALCSLDSRSTHPAFPSPQRSASGTT